MMFKVFLLLPVVLFILASYPPVVKAGHKLIISREYKEVTAIKEGEVVDIATFKCAGNEQVRFFHDHPTLQMIYIGASTADGGGTAGIAKYSFGQLNLTAPVNIRITAECSGHNADISLTINPNREQPPDPIPVPKPSKSISPIGNLNPDESKSITVVGLDDNTTYSWTVSKMTQIDLLKNRGYTLITDCSFSDSRGQIVKDLGPYHTPGLYRLDISRAIERPNVDGNPCTPSGKPILSQDFSVGQKVKGCGDAGDKRGPAIATAIGCVHTNPAEFVKDMMTFIIGISGGLAFLMMLLGAFQMLTSQGNPETLNAGRERLTSAVIGLLFIIFAVLFLQIIGVDILNIPGFKRN